MLSSRSYGLRPCRHRDHLGPCGINHDLLALQCGSQGCQTCKCLATFVIFANIKCVLAYGTRLHNWRYAFSRSKKVLFDGCLRYSELLHVGCKPFRYYWFEVFDMDPYVEFILACLIVSHEYGIAHLVLMWNSGAILSDIVFCWFEPACDLWCASQTSCPGEACFVVSWVALIADANAARIPALDHPRQGTTDFVFEPYHLGSGGYVLALNLIVGYLLRLVLQWCRILDGSMFETPCQGTRLHDRR